MHMPVVQYQINTTVAGVDGSATGTTTTELPIQGRIEGIYIKFPGSTPGTTDTTITIDQGLATETILVISNSGTSAWYYPRAKICDAAGTLGVAGDNLWDKFAVNGKMTVTFTQSNAGAFSVLVVYSQ
jgi:hypothetical protein